MNGDRLEQLVLSGGLFQTQDRSSSPARSLSSGSDGGSSDPLWGNQVGEVGAQTQLTSSIGMGPGRTGVKGVIRDRNEAAARERSKKADELANLAARMERANLGGKTFLEDQNERAILEWQRGQFGHLREVGLKGFVPAVEEGQNVWVVVHIYDPSLDRCDTIDDRLARLAREHPNTKFIRCRASTIGFALMPGAKPRSSRPPSSTYLSKSRTTPRFPEQEEDDPYGDDVEVAVVDTPSEDEDEEDVDVDVDTDMLPTMLVYRSGQLVHNWVRVDWEAGSLGIDEFLKKHHIIQPTRVGESLTVPLDDEDDLVFGNPEVV
ncbi:hypothetical protein EDB92DRAFT_1842964 [Lactarius akahatsu]|uniref:Phosducin domain-containing protein n=1 Tax=Lactarius akahatsu TaxID=416441 RepID=A0AAD4LLF7_9AGAM|nr:hypothetical protein EDB92DRAFT_1842964 [Lactarius akahatsu]